MKQNKLSIKLTAGCLNCDRPIPLSIAKKGIVLCSEKCLKKINKLGGNFDIKDVWKKDKI